MAHAELVARMSYAEYLDRERTSTAKHEYLRGGVSSTRDSPRG
jgi:hypothetical protein